MMQGSSVGPAFVKIASVYMVAALVLGVVMGMTQSFALVSVHSHLGLLGWATMAIAGLVYIAAPRCGRSRLSRVHFWLHNTGLPLMVLSLVWKEYGSSVQAEKAVGIGSLLVLAALLFFTIKLFKNLRNA